MKRLIRKADEVNQQPVQQTEQPNPTDNADVAKDMDAVKTLLSRIDEASHNLKDVYYVLFDNLNALYESYPDLYQQIEMTVKLPKNEDALNVVQFDNDLHDILGHFQDEQYLATYISPVPEQNPQLDGLEPKDTGEELNNNGFSDLPEQK